MARRASSRSPRAAVAALAVVLSTLLVPSAAGSTPTLDELDAELDAADRAQQELARDRAGIADDLARTQAEIAAVGRQLTASQARVAVLEARLEQLRRDLAAARVAAHLATEAMQDATAELVGLTGELTGSEGELDTRRRRLDDRAARTSMGGELDAGRALLGVTADVGTLLHARHALGTVLETDRTEVRDVTTATVALERLRTRADDQRDRVAELEAAAAEQAARLAGLTADAADVAAQAEVERHRQQQLYDRLEDKEAATLDELAVLDTQSDRLEEQLAGIRGAKAAELARLAAARAARERAARARENAGRSGGGGVTSVGGSGTGGDPGVDGWVWPSSGRISSGFGHRTHPIYGTSRLHAGVDIAGGYGQPVLAAQAGEVIQAYCEPGGYGCRVVVDHGGGIATLYAHLSAFDVGAGQQVAAGDLLARTGSTGASTGPHLHFEVRANGAPVDPMLWY